MFDVVLSRTHGQLDWDWTGRVLHPPAPLSGDFFRVGDLHSPMGWLYFFRGPGKGGGWLGSVGDGS